MSPKDDSTIPEPDVTPAAADAPEIDEWLAENYREKAAERGTTLPDMAPEYDEHSPRLAAWMRSQRSTDASQAPQDRQAPEKSEA